MQRRPKRKFCLLACARGEILLVASFVSLAIFSSSIDGGSSRGKARKDPEARSPSPKPKVHGRNPFLIPEWITEHSGLKDAKARLPDGYEFELAKTAWTLKRKGARRVALQMPEGLLRCASVISDCLKAVVNVTSVTLSDVVYGACCLEDHRAKLLGCDYLIHYGHSCLVPVDHSKLPVLYVFVTLRLEIPPFIEAVRRHFNISSASSSSSLSLSPPTKTKKIALMGTIQFVGGMGEARRRMAKSFGKELEIEIPQAQPLSPGETLGCTSPRVAAGVSAVVFVADGTFHLEAAMLQNRHVPVFLRYDPYTHLLLRANYSAQSVVSGRKECIQRAANASTFGIIQGTLGRQGNPRIIERLENLLKRRKIKYILLPVPEVTPALLNAFDQIDAWIQVACPRLSIDWGLEYSSKPILTSYEAFIALGEEKWKDNPTGYPMDFYANRGGSWSNYWNPQKARLSAS